MCAPLVHFSYRMTELVFPQFVDKYPLRHTLEIHDSATTQHRVLYQRNETSLPFFVQLTETESYAIFFDCVVINAFYSTDFSQNFVLAGPTLIQNGNGSLESRGVWNTVIRP